MDKVINKIAGAGEAPVGGGQAPALRGHPAQGPFRQTRVLCRDQDGERQR